LNLFLLLLDEGEFYGVAGGLIILNFIIQIPKGESLSFLRFEHILYEVDEVVGVAIIADTDQFCNLLEVYLTGLVVVEVVEVLHHHQGQHSHPERERIGGPLAFVAVVCDLQRVDLLRER
jgi:hypothetical protein